MSVQLADKGDHYEVSTISAPGTRKKLPRLAVVVPKGDDVALAAEIERQEQAAQLAFGVGKRTETLVD